MHKLIKDCCLFTHKQYMTLEKDEN